MRKGGLKIKPTDLLWLIIFTVYLFQNPLNIWIPVFRRVDELTTIFFGIYTIFYLITKSRFSKDYSRMYRLMAYAIIIGVLGNYLSGIRRSVFMIALDIIYLFKVFICFIGASLYFSNSSRKGRLLDLMAAETTIIVWFAFICLLISQISNIGMTRGVRYGINCFHFVYSSAGMFSQYCIIFLVILTSHLAVKHITYARISTLGILIIVWASTCRTRAFVIICIWIFVCIASRKEKKMQSISNNTVVKKIFNPVKLFLIAGLTLVLGSSAIDKYFGDGVITARSLLFEGGLKIMKDYFPIGAGFATYGTETAATYYSPLYSRYGLSSFWALAEGGSELTDCYWPAIIGELGFVGCILMVVLVYLFVRKYLNLSSESKFFTISAITYTAYLLFSSTATAIFASYVTAEFMVIIVAIMNSQKFEKARGEI